MVGGTNKLKIRIINSVDKYIYGFIKLRTPLNIFISFWAIAIGLWQTSGNIFYLFNFGFSLLFVFLSWFVYQYHPIPMSKSELAWLVGGNTFNFASAFILAFALKDNRAFCKYLCPITVLLKITARFAFLKIEGNKDNCTQCGACNKACPMDINVMEYVKNRERVLSTECIFCLTCTTVCPETTLNSTFKMDIGGKERIRRVESAKQKKE